MNDTPRKSSRGGQRAANYAALLERFWRRNLKLVGWLLAVWAFAGFGCGILLADWLNRFSLGGMPLGFWFAHQGSIIVFVLTILFFCLAMNRRDARHREELRGVDAETGGGL